MFSLCYLCVPLSPVVGPSPNDQHTYISFSVCVCVETTIFRWGDIYIILRVHVSVSASSCCVMCFSWTRSKDYT